MRWKLKDPLADCAPWFRKRIWCFTDFRHVKTTRSGTSGKNTKQNQKTAPEKTLPQNQLKSSTKTSEHCQIQMIHKGGRHTRLRLLWLLKNMSYHKLTYGTSHDVTFSSHFERLQDHKQGLHQLNWSQTTSLKNKKPIIGPHIMKESFKNNLNDSTSESHGV